MNRRTTFLTAFLFAMICSLGAHAFENSFGRDVAQVGNDVLIGAPDIENGPGTAYLMDSVTGAIRTK